jgi:hypothetical protein
MPRRDVVQIVFANEKVRSDYTLPAPPIQESEAGIEFRLLCLESLVRMKLTSFRDKDRTRIRDLIGVGLVDVTWLTKLPPQLSERLKQILDTSEG